mgnify:CR=1 FL=1
MSKPGRVIGPEEESLSFNGSTSNGILTYGGANQIDVESDLTFSSNNLGNVGGNLNVIAGGSLSLFGGPVSVTSGRIDIYGSTSSAAYINLYEDTDNGTNAIRFIAPESCSNQTVTLPDATGTVQLQGASTGQIINAKLNRDDIYVLYLNTRTYWYSVSGSAGYTGELNVSAGNWTSWSDDRQARHAGYIATRNCKVNKVRFVGLFSTSYTSGALDFEFAIQKWTPGNDTTNTVTTTHMTHTDHDGSYTEGRIYNLEFDVSGNNALTAGDCFSLFARCVDSNSSARLQLWYGGCTAEIELT